MFCPYCGKMLPDYANFCAWCTRRVRFPEAPSSVQQTGTAAGPKAVSDPAPSSSFREPAASPAAPAPAKPVMDTEAAVSSTAAVVPKEEHFPPAPVPDGPAVTPDNGQQDQNGGRKYERKTHASGDEIRALEPLTDEAYSLCADFYSADMNGDKDGKKALYLQMEELYGKMIPLADIWMGNDYLDSLAALSMLLARYCCEDTYNPDDGEEFADSAVEIGEKYLSMYEDTLDEKGKIRKKVELNLARTYAAYIAYNQNYLDYALEVASKMPVSVNSLALCGSAECVIANAEKDTLRVRKSLFMLEKMDEMANAPASNTMQKDIFRFAYGWYGLMLAENAETYPEGGFQDDIPKAIEVLKHGIALIGADDKEFSGPLFDDIVKYSARL